MPLSPLHEPSINVTSVATGTLDELRGADFTDIAQLDVGQLEAILELAGQIKAGSWRQTPLAGRSIALMFQKPSVRTRVSFDVGITRLGGPPITLHDGEVGLGLRESVKDVR